MIFSRILEHARRSKVRVIVGVGEPHSVERLVAAVRLLRAEGLPEPTLIGEEKLKGHMHEVEFLPSSSPEEEALRLLTSGEVNGVVRGTLSSSVFLKQVKAKFKVNKTFRVALLETAKNHQFMFAPVGVDEGGNVEEKVRLAVEAANFLRKIGMKEKISVLSGGRLGDVGRSQRVDATIREAEVVAANLRERGYNAEHYQILIENAVSEGANVIIAPDGISGNLIYRTLVHLGSGRSYGALYANMRKVIIDTSRAAPPNEYLGAVAMAAAVSVLQK